VFVLFSEPLFTVFVCVLTLVNVLVIELLEEFITVIDAECIFIVYFAILRFVLVISSARQPFNVILKDRFFFLIRGLNIYCKLGSVEKQSYGNRKWRTFVSHSLKIQFQSILGPHVQRIRFVSFHVSYVKL
jgi:hypothetical protein